MADFAPRLDDMKFVLREVVGIERVAALAGYEDATPDLVDAVLEEAGKFGRDVLAPLGFDPGRTESVVLVENGKTYVSSTAALCIARKLGGGYTLLYVLIAVPRFLRDAVYNAFAARRYRCRPSRSFSRNWIARTPPSSACSITQRRSRPPIRDRSVTK